jgi:hypothetical protein
MLKKFFKWGYVKFVFVPMLKELANAEGTEYEIIFEPDFEITNDDLPDDVPRIH